MSALLSLERRIQKCHVQNYNVAATYLFCPPLLKDARKSIMSGTWLINSKTNMGVQMLLLKLFLEICRHLVKSILYTSAQILQPNAMSFFSPDISKNAVQSFPCSVSIWTQSQKITSREKLSITSISPKPLRLPQISAASAQKSYPSCAYVFSAALLKTSMP
jgi:hypothetical protein